MDWDIIWEQNEARRQVFGVDELTPEYMSEVREMMQDMLFAQARRLGG